MGTGVDVTTGGKTIAVKAVATDQGLDVDFTRSWQGIRTCFAGIDRNLPATAAVSAPVQAQT